MVFLKYQLNITCFKDSVKHKLKGIIDILVCVVVTLFLISLNTLFRS